MTGPGRIVAEGARRHPLPFAVTLAYLAGFAALALLRDDQRLWAFLVVLAIGVLVVAAVDRTVGLSRSLVWALTALGLLHLCGGLLPPIGDAPTFYETWLVAGVLKFDQAVHFAGSAIATVFAWQVLGHYVDPARTSARVQAQLAAVAGLGKGAINEVIEFLGAHQFAGTAIGPSLNTSWDLVFNLAGAVAAAVWLAITCPHVRAARPVTRPRRPVGR